MPRVRPRVVLSSELLEARINPVSFSTIGYAAGSNVLSVAIGDVNGDGHSDIVAGTGDSTQINILLNDGTGAFTSGTNVPIGAPFHVKLADIDGDGKLDIYAANSYGQQLVVALGNGDGTFQTPIARNFSNYTHGAEAADFNGDGRLDIVVADTDGAALLMNDGSADFFSPTTFYHPAIYPGSLGVEAGDFNEDGKPDFALIEYDAHRLDVYLNNGDGTFAEPTPYANMVAAGSRTILAEDFTNDGHLDFIVGFEYSPLLALYRGNGDGTFQSPEQIDPQLDWPGPLATGDLDADGDLDLVVMQAGNGDEIVLLNDGSGAFEVRSVVVYSYPGSVAVGDVSGDGLPDLVTGLALSPGTVHVSLNTTPVVHSFTLSAPLNATAGQAIAVTVTAKDSTGATMTDYAGTVRFSSTDPGAQLPADAKLTNGVGTFSLTLMTGGIAAISVADKVVKQSVGTSNPIAVTRLIPPVVADFGTLGLYRWTDIRHWKSHKTVTAEQFITSADGLAVFADFGADGLHRWTRSGGWIALTGANVESVASSFDGETVIADFGRGGLKRWTEAAGWTRLATANVQSAHLSDDGKTVVADFGRRGLRRWSEGLGWSRVTALNPLNLAVSADGNTIVADFALVGLWRWTANDNRWAWLSPSNVERVGMSTDGNTVVADFGAGGLRRWTVGGGWVTLSTLNAENIAIALDGQTVVADFGSNGLRRWTLAGGWSTLSNANAQNIALSSDGGTIVADFGREGFWHFESTWTQLSTLDPKQISVA